MAAPLSSGIKNWHWRFKTQLPTVEGKDASSGLVVKITGVTAIEGDVTVGQRKSKLLTIYDLDMTLSWSATTEDGTELSGTLRIPEVSHEAIDGISDYVFDFSSPSTTSPSYQLVKKLLPPPLKELFTLFQSQLIEVHGKDLLVVDGPATPASGSGASTPAAAAAVVEEEKAAAPAAAVEKKGGPSINTSTVKVEGRFQISAADLWGLLTDERKIPSWSRSPAQFSATPSAPYSLFSGGVQGTIESVNAPSQLVMSWALKSSPSWPKDHYGVLTITLEQGSDSTTATFTLTGVPKGQERELENNLHAFYVRGLGSDLSAGMSM
ncbi:activator of Hsp90 ATPase [Mrakia frigida]|uniref:AHA1 family protein n=1 Tax=Mrakia frigida TaxID=29902 RepID=UPI003FCBF973